MEGNVYFDEISIHELSEFEVRKNTTIISHDVPLLGATLIKAVSYNNQEKNKVKLLNLIKELDCDFLECHEKDLSFKIGDSGEKLTINERIVLQFIRAFMTNKNIILIDDVINQLAGVQKEKIIHKLNSLSLNKTIIFYSNHKITELNVARTIHL